jgi:recombination protein RecT
VSNNQIAVVDEVRRSLTQMQPQFAAALPKHVTPERFLRVTMTAVQNSPNLLDCDRRSLYAACMKAAQDGLLPDGREGAIIPRKGSAAWQPMVAGIMKKVRNSGEISTWSVHTVRENDEFDYELGDNERIVHKPARRNRGELIGAYSIVVMKDGERSREYMDVDEIEAIRDRSDGYQYAKRNNKPNPWTTDPGEMFKKTVIRRHAKRLPMSTDLDDLLRQDDHLFETPDQVRAQEPAQPDVPPPAAEPAPPPARRRGASRLADVAAQAPAPNVDTDGVIDMPPAPPVDIDDGDSPI